MGMDAYAYYGTFVKIPKANLQQLSECCGKLPTTPHCPTCGRKASYDVPELVEDCGNLERVSASGESHTVYAIRSYTHRITSDDKMVMREGVIPWEMPKEWDGPIQYLLDHGGILIQNALVLQLSY